MREHPINAPIPGYDASAGAELKQPELWPLQQPLTQSALLNAHLQSQLQYQMAKQQVYQAQPATYFPSSSSIPGASSMGRSRFETLDLPNSVLGPQPEPAPAWPMMQHSSNFAPGMHGRPVMLHDWQDSSQINALQADEVGLPQYIPPTGPYVPARNPQFDAQMLAIDKLRREMSCIQNELDRAEREVVRQKSLRETERLEFTEAKDRLKHSWANDREDFARVKTILKMKNAEHHAQSGRLSQQLKDCQACNRALRDLALRHGIPVPVELDGSQVKRVATSPFTDDGHPTDKAVLVPTASSTVVYGRGSLDSYFQDKLVTKDNKCHSFPDLLAPQLSLQAGTNKLSVEATTEISALLHPRASRGQTGA